MLEARIRGHVGFKASNGWFDHWRWRYNVKKSVRLQGEAGDIDIAAVEQDIEMLRCALKEYSPGNIFNMDETGLFFRAIPNHSYLMANEGDQRQEGRGCKAMKAKDRLTVVLCVNATGTCKVDPVVIGSAKKPRCFKDNPPTVPYFWQKNAWNDQVNYRKWWDTIFLPKIRAWTTQPVALVIDGFSGHDENCIDPQQQVKVFKFPPNVTALYQPLDQGIIAALKTGYKSRLLEKLVEVIGNFEQLQALASQLPAGCAGLRYACPPHVGDACLLLKDAWDHLSPSAIVGCWGHSRCLGVAEAAEMVSIGRDYKKEVQSECIHQMCKVLSCLSLSNPSVTHMGLDSITKAVHDVQGTATGMLQRWLDLEEEEGMIDVNDEGGDSEVTSDQHVQPMEDVALIDQALPLLKELHRIGAKRGDDCMTDMARDMCIHLKASVTHLHPQQPPV